MSIAVDPISDNKVISSNIDSQSKYNDKDNKQVSTKVVMGVLSAIGITALAILAIKNKKKPTDIKKIIGKDPKVEKLTEIEKEKLIKELQSKTDNPEVKEEIRRLVENGEWDKL